MLASADHRHPAVLKWLAVAACAAASAGCYKFVPATLETVPVGTDVRAVLSAAAQQDVQDRLRLNAREIEGTLIEDNGDKVLLSVRAAKGLDGLGGDVLYQRIDVPRDGVVRVDIKRLDPLRTAGVAGLAVGTAVFVAVRAFGGNDPGGPDGTPPGPNDHRIGATLLRLPIFR